uniref:Uncharacterized protein n=1 Tax=Ciona savignyi TaxID=51511 RepID=H2Y476_CIOSA
PNPNPNPDPDPNPKNDFKNIFNCSKYIIKQVKATTITIALKLKMILHFFILNFFSHMYNVKFF